MQDPPVFSLTILALSRGYVVTGLGGAIACRTPSEVGRTVRNALLQVERHQQERIAPPTPPQPPLPPPPEPEPAEFDPEPVAPEDSYAVARRHLTQAADELVVGLLDQAAFYSRLAPFGDELDEDEVEAEISRAEVRLNERRQGVTA